MTETSSSSAATGHLPEVLCNEDNVFFIVGGFSHDAARIALALHLRDCEGLSAEDAYVWANDVRIETRWMKWSDDDPEAMVPASEVERGSTLVHSYGRGLMAPENAATVLVEAILAWCDHIDSRSPATPDHLRGAQRLYYDGMRDGVKECIAQVRQAVVHGFDVAALDGRPLT